jgi:hypothetical protein
MNTTSLGDRRPSPCDALDAPRVGQFYLDTRTRRLFCLNDTARQMRESGIPLVGSEPAAAHLRTPDGDVAAADRLPLVVAARDGRAAEAEYRLALPGHGECRLHQTAAPLKDASGRVIAILLGVVSAPPPPDWETLAGLAHDLRTPLQTMQLLLGTLGDRSLVETEQGKFLGIVRGAAERAQQIAKDVLDWCRAPGVRGRATAPAWFPLAPLLTELVGEQRSAARRKALALAAELDLAAGWEVQTDRVRLGRVLANQLVNAIRYTPAGGRVTVGTAWEDRDGERWLAVSVLDTGVGIAADEKDSIFHAFERGQAGRDSDILGSGVGLSVVDRLTHDLGLRCDLASETGRGSVFRVLIPLRLLRMAPPG